MNKVKTILVFILIAMIVMAVSTATRTIVVLLESNTNKEWRDKRDRENAAIKEYIKIVSDVDIDSAVTDQQVYNMMFKKLRDEYTPSPRGIKLIIANNKGNKK